MIYFWILPKFYHEVTGLNAGTICKQTAFCMMLNNKDLIMFKLTETVKFSSTVLLELQDVDEMMLSEHTKL